MSEREQPTGERGDHDQEQAQQTDDGAACPELPPGEPLGESITSGRAAEWRVEESRSLPVLGEGMVLRSSILRRIKVAERPAVMVTGVFGSRTAARRRLRHARVHKGAGRCRLDQQTR